MYSSRRLNKNLVDGNKYITVGDPYVDQGKTVPERWQKKQFAVKSRPENAENGFFSKLSYAGGSYQPNILYIQTQPLEKRKKGFGTRDAFKTDEFTSVARTEQYRETLRREAEIFTKHRNPEEDDRKLREHEDQQRRRREAMGSTFLYDVGRTRVTEFDPRKTRDSHYSFDTTRGRDVGGYRPTSMDIGENSWDCEYKPPASGAVSQIKQFYDKGHLQGTFGR